MLSVVGKLKLCKPDVFLLPELPEAGAKCVAQVLWGLAPWFLKPSFDFP